MERNQFENLKGMNPSLLGFGTMRLPVDENGKVDRVRFAEMVDYGMSHGLNYFDTAYPYHDGDSELAVGEVLSKYPRESYYLTDKLPYSIWKSKDPVGEMKRIFFEQLKKCQTEYFDFYLFHSYQKEIFEISEQCHAYEFLQEMQKEGKIRKIGFSFHSGPEVLKTILDAHHWDACQLQMNYHDWDFIRTKQCYELCEEYKVPVFVMEPIRGGNLLKISDSLQEELSENYPGQTLASWALRWVASHSNVLVVNSGMSNMEQLKENVDTLITDFNPLTQNEYEVIEKLRNDFSKNTIVPCTGCKYCMPCPKGVNIPRIFAVLNDSTRVDIPFHSQMYYARHIPDSEKADNCVKCGKCKSHCPQHIDIPTELAKAHEMLHAEISK